MNTSEKLHPGNTTFADVVIIGLPLHVLGVNTAGAVIGKKNAWKGLNCYGVAFYPARNN